MVAATVLVVAVGKCVGDKMKMKSLAMTKFSNFNCQNSVCHCFCIVVVVVVGINVVLPRKDDDCADTKHRFLHAGHLIFSFVWRCVASLSISQSSLSLHLALSHNPL